MSEPIDWKASDDELIERLEYAAVGVVQLGPHAAAMYIPATVKSLLAGAAARLQALTQERVIPDEETVAKIIARFADQMVATVSRPGRVSIAEAASPARDILALFSPVKGGEPSCTDIARTGPVARSETDAAEVGKEP